MTNSYNNLWNILIDKEMDKGYLCNTATISKGTMDKMTNNKLVTLTVIQKICDIRDIVQITNINKDRR